MRHGRLLALLICAALAVPATAAALAGQPPPHPVTGGWKGHNGAHGNVGFRVSHGEVLNFHTGLPGVGVITFDKSEISHGHFDGVDDGGTYVTGTFQRPNNPNTQSRHVTGTLYPPSGTVSRVGYQAHPSHGSGVTH